MKKVIFAALAVLVAGSAFAGSGRTDENKCHTKKNYARECFGENEGKYIPVSEEKRLAKLRYDTCHSLDGEGRRVKFDLYGKPCRSRK